MSMVSGSAFNALGACRPSIVRSRSGVFRTRVPIAFPVSRSCSRLDSRPSCASAHANVPYSVTFVAWSVMLSTMRKCRLERYDEVRSDSAMSESEGMTSLICGAIHDRLDIVNAVTTTTNSSRNVQELRYIPVLAAVAFAVMLTVGYAWVPAPPDLGATGAEVVDWARTNSAAMPIQGWLVLAGWIPGLALFALVRERLSGAGATAYVLGGVTVGATLSVAILIRLALAAHSNSLDPGIARALASVEIYWGSVAAIFVALQSGALAFAIRHAILPAWLAVLSAILATEQLIESFTMLGVVGFFAPGGGLTQIGGVLFGLWIVAQGVAIRGAPRRL